MTKKKYSFKHYRRLQRERHMKKKELSTKNRNRYSPGCSSMSLKKQRFAVFMVNSHPWIINFIIWLVKFMPTNPRVCYPKNKFRALNIRSITRGQLALTSKTIKLQLKPSLTKHGLGYCFQSPTVSLQQDT